MQSSVCIAVFALLLSVNLSSARSDVKLLPEAGLFCVKEGLNSHPEDCTQFIVCSRSIEGGFNGAIYKCSDGEAFDEKTLTCVRDDQVSGCKRRFARQAILLKPTTTTTTTTTEPPTINCQNKPFLCRDCNTLSICFEKNNTFEHLIDIPCTENGQMAYCDETIAACTNKVPPTCPSNFLCTGTGYFPDPTDCTKYQICHPEDDKIVAATQYCGTNQVYSTTKKMCVVKKSVSDCHKVTCPSGIQSVPFPGDASYYAICINGKPDFVFYCGESKEFNSAKNTCEVVCKEAGRMPDVDDCRKYYECTPNRIGGTFTLTSHTCPVGTIYDNTYQFCVVGSTCN